MRLLRPLLACAALLLALASSAFAQESVHTIRRGFVSPITPEMKAHLRAIKLRGDALGRTPGLLGQWGDSITDTQTYLGNLGSWTLIEVPPADGHDYLPTLYWMGATWNSADNPLSRNKGGNYCNNSGWRVDDALGAIDDAILRANPSWSLTMYGTNDITDATWNPAVFASRLERLVQINLDAGIVPVLSTIPPRVGYLDRVDQANAVIPQVAARMHIPLVDLHGVMMALHPTDWSILMHADGIHLSYNHSPRDLTEIPQRDCGANLRSMLTVDMAEKLRAVVFDNGAPDGANLPILVVTSSTHPYKVLTSSLAPAFSFLHDSGPAPTAYSWSIDQSPWTEPDTVAETTANSVTSAVTAPGTWYFHVRANSAAGWGPAAHYCVRATDAPTLELRHETGTTSGHRDTFITVRSRGNDNYGAAFTLDVYNDTTIGLSRGLFAFNLTGVPTANLESATLILNANTAVTAAVPWEIFSVTSAWTEGTGSGFDDASGVTWATAPTYATTAAATGTLATGTSTIEADVTALARDWLAHPEANHGVMFQHRNRNLSLTILSRENGAATLRPTLRLRYATTVDLVPPTAPGGLTATLVGSDSASLAWPAATDNVGVATYRIYRNGAFLATTSGLTFTDPGLPVASSFSYAVSAVDATGNEGPATPPAAVTTPTPTLYAGADSSTTLAGGACLDATFPGLNTGTALRWAQVSGPATASIVNPTNPHSAAYFTSGGSYTFRCTVTSGGSTYTDDVVVTVDDAPLRRRTVNVTTASQLRSALAAAQNGDIILLADGLYDLAATSHSDGTTWARLSDVNDITIRSASDNPAAVTLRGAGFTLRASNMDGLWLERCARVTVRSLTFAEFGAYALKLEASFAPVPSDIRIENCHFRAIGMRCIKGSIANAGDLVHRGWVKGCHFENTALPPDYGTYSGDYIAAIDMMGLCNWEIADNDFINVMGRTGEGRAAVFLWHQTRGAVVERNLISGCDRGIAFGNPGGSTDNHAHWSLARNNLIVMGRSAGLTTGESIEQARTHHCRIYHNTAWVTSASARGIRCSDIVEDLDIANNLIRGQPRLVTGATAHHNLLGDVSAALFVNVAGGDFHLAASAATAIGQGAVLASVTTDFDLVARDAAPDLGAFEYVAPVPQTYAAWRTANFTSADLTNDAVSGPNADPDGCGLANFARYAFALPARGFVASPITLGSATSAGATYLTLTFPRRTTAADLTYTLESSTDLTTWTVVPGCTYSAGSGPITAQDAVAMGNAPRRFLRLRVTTP